MGIFGITDTAGFGFNMSGVDSLGSVFIPADPSVQATLKTNVGGPEGLATYGISGASPFNGLAIWYSTLDSVNIRIDAIVYYRGDEAIAYGQNLNLSATSADLASPLGLLNLTLGSDKIYGSASPNFIEGGFGDDGLFGGASADVIDGGPGLDFIWGGAGTDTLVGGTEADTFWFATPEDAGKKAARDVIVGFERGLDKIDLGDIDADETKDGHQKFDFIGRAKFSKEAGELQMKNGIVRADIDGNGKADFEIHVGVKLGAGDFTL